MGGDPMYGEPIETYPGPMGMGDPMDMGMPGMGCEAGMGCDGGMNGPCQVCPHCGLYDMPPGYGGVNGESWGPACQCGQPRTRYFADVQFNFLRAHVMENFAGQLSEKFEFSPRLIVGFEGTERSTAGPGIGTMVAVCKFLTTTTRSASTWTFWISKRRGPCPSENLPF